MQYRRLGSSGLQVSVVGLGTNNFGRRLDENGSAAVVREAVEQGVNFIDTANLYGGGLSEEYIGKSINGLRAKVLITTKASGKVGEGANLSGASRKHVMAELEKALGRLGTDYIDLYSVHFPDSSTPIEETLRTLDDAVHQGKVRYIGCSNFSAWQACEAVWVGRHLNLNPMVCVQVHYNMITRDVEKELLPFCRAYNMGIIPYFPLASGFLTGKYHQGEPLPQGARLTASPEWGKRYFTEDNYRVLSSLEAFAKERGHTMGELAIAWLLNNPLVGSVIAGATRPEQVAANAKGGDWQLTPEDMKELDTILGRG